MWTGILSLKCYSIIALVAGCTASAAAALLGLGVCFYRYGHHYFLLQHNQLPRFEAVASGIDLSLFRIWSVHLGALGGKRSFSRLFTRPLKLIQMCTKFRDVIQNQTSPNRP